MQLIIGDRAYSTWSLRPWLVLKRCGAEFEEVVVPLNRADTAVGIARHSPSGRVPALHVEGVTIWDSLAIAVWCGERWPRAGLWPENPHARWLARSVTCEMHSGFPALRTVLAMGPDHPMVSDERAPTPTDPAALADIRRIVEIWCEMRGRFGAGGPYLFGDWSIADAFFTPVAARFRHFQVDLAAHGDDRVAQAYAEALLAQPDFLAWSDAARADAAH
jgi:glutathione S-transferase